MLDFPNAPTVGQKYPTPAVAGLPVYTWDGEKWTTSGNSIIGQYVAKAGDTMTGHLTLPTGPAAANAVRKDYVDAAIAGLPAPPVAATYIEFLANSAPTKMLTSGAVWTAAPAVTLTDAANVTPDQSLGIDFYWVLNVAGATRALKNFANAKVGQKGVIYIRQDATGGRAITWDTGYMFPGGVKPTLSPAPNAVDAISYVWVSAVGYICTFIADIR